MGSWGDKAYWLAAAALLAAYACLGVWQKASTGIQVELLLLVLLVAPGHLARLLAWFKLLPRPTPVWLGLEALLLLGVGSRTVAEWSLWLAVGLACCRGVVIGRPDVSAPTPLRISGQVATVLGWVACCAFAVAGRGGGWLSVVISLAFLLEALVPSVLPSASAAVRRLSVGALLIGLPLVRDGLFVELPELCSLPLILLSLVALTALRFRATPLAQRRKTTRRWLVRLLVPLLFLSVGWVCGEVLFRIVPNSYANKNYGWEGTFHVPGGEHIYTGMHLGKRQPPNRLVWNSGGWHDTDHEVFKPEGVVRVLVLGDSFVEGIQVPVEALYHKRLEAELSAVGSATVEAISYSWSGWGQRQELAALTEGFETSQEGVRAPAALDFQPDLVVVGFLPSNDVRNNHWGLQEAATEQGYNSTFALHWYATAVRLGLPFTAFLCERLDAFLRRVAGQAESVDTDVYRAEPHANEAAWEEAWSQTEALFHELDTTLAKRGISLAVVVMTGVFETQGALGNEPIPGGNSDYPTQRMLEIGQRLGIPVLRMTDAFKAASEGAGPPLFVDGDNHWSAAGHALAARETARFLREKGLGTSVAPR